MSYSEGDAFRIDPGVDEDAAMASWFLIGVADLA